MDRLQDRYIKTIQPAVAKQFELKNVMATPHLVKVTINMGMGDSLKDPTLIEKMTGVLKTITGQKPVSTKSKKSIASFNLRQGDVIGLKVTLRRDKMWDFVEKVAQIVLPRVKDFRGINPEAFDPAGNYTLGLEDFFVFPELDPAKLNIKSKGLAITFTIRNGSKEKSRYLLEQIGFLFKTEKDKE